MTGIRDTKCSIHDTELAEWLDQTVEQLDEIVAFFDRDPDDDWDLSVGEDYIFVNARYRERRFSPKGALKIASYLDANQQRSLIDRIKDFITQHDRRLRLSLARRLIHEELSAPGKIIFWNQRAMMHKQSLRRILETNGARFNRSFEELKNAQLPLEPDVDYAELESEFWFSGSGAFRIARNLSENLTNKCRRKSCDAVCFSLKPVIRQIESAEAHKVAQINRAKNAAKRRDQQRCQVTETRSTRNDRFDLVAHHLYCVKKYPHLATNLENLVSLREEIHKEFHNWMGGNGNPCTIDNFIEFLHNFYPENDSLSFELHRRKHVINV